MDPTSRYVSLSTSRPIYATARPEALFAWRNEPTVGQESHAIASDGLIELSGA